MIWLALALAATASTAPVRTAAERQTLVELAHVLGEAHALHRICAGPTDDTWRGRMQHLIEVEAPPEFLKSELSSSFNAGFTSKDAQAKDCPAAGAAERALSRKGAELARKLGHSGR